MNVIILATEFLDLIGNGKKVAKEASVKCRRKCLQIEYTEVEEQCREAVVRPAKAGITMS